jgi:hypothetical protein
LDSFALEFKSQSSPISQVGLRPRKHRRFHFVILGQGKAA